MAKISVNPLKWFNNKEVPPTPAPQKPTGSASRPAKPKKSGNIFMHLISLQKNLQAADLSLREQIDCKLLMEKCRTIVVILKLEAEKVEEDDIAQGAGQILAYLDTVLEDRLDVDEEGITTLLDFVLMFKDALGDTMPGIRKFDDGQFEEWNNRYQALMARMKPMEETIPPSISQSEPEERLPEPVVEIVEPSVPVNGSAGADPEKQDVATAEELIFSRIDATGSNGSNGAASSEKAEAERCEEGSPVVNAGDVVVRDVTIPDGERKSARELLEQELGIVPAASLSKEDMDDAGIGKVEETAPRNGHDGNNHVKNPVQLEEVERLKNRLFELHEKQEMLSTRMSGILCDLKKAVDSEEREPVSIEKLDIEEIEDLIFIGRQKG